MKRSSEEKAPKVFFKGVISGLGWAFGSTIGFIIIISLASYVFNLLGGLPLIGELLAKIIVITNKAMEAKSGI